MFRSLRKKIALWRIRRVEKKINRTGLHIVEQCYAPMRRYNEDGSFTGGKTMLMTNFALEQNKEIEEEYLKRVKQICRHPCNVNLNKQFGIIRIEEFKRSNE